MIVLPPDVRETILAHAREGYPNEVCGVLVGRSHGVDPTARREAVVAGRARNLEAARPNDRYRLDPADMARASALARERGLEIVGFYHSPTPTTRRDRLGPTSRTARRGAATATRSSRS
jgi:proteasome lid subunit RPN8/RPN11